MSGWKKVSLSELAESVDYGVTASATDHPLGPKFLRITDIQNGSVNWQSVPWCECDKRSATEARLKAGDIVFARTGATTGKSFLIQDCPADSVFASYLIRVRVGSDADSRFVSHFFQTESYWAQIAKGARGVAQPGVNATTLKALQIPLPPLAEQRRIAEVLDKAEALRAKRRAALAQLDSLTQSLFLDLFGDPATNPKGWPNLALGEVVKLVGGFAFKSENFAEEGKAIVRISNLTGDGIDLNGIARIPDDKLGNGVNYKIKPGDILIAMSGATTGKIGIAPLELPEELYLNQRVGSYRIRDTSLIQREFLLELLRSIFYQRFLWQLAAGAAQPNVSGTQLESASIPLPPISLQHEFARRITAVEKLKTTQRAALAELDALFASLQHRAFRGEL